MIRALIFDFDGLILDTETPVFRSWQELYQAYGHELSLGTWSEIIGTAEGTYDPLAELAAETGHPLDRETIEEQRRQREMALIAAEEVLPGVRDYLEDARSLGLMLAVASSSSCAWVTGHLERLDLLGYFDTIKTNEDVAQAKPEPDLYRAVLDEFNLRPQEALVFEDSPNGILAAKRAGLFCIAVPNALTRQLPLDKADLRLDSLAEIPLEALLQKIEREVEL